MSFEVKLMIVTAIGVLVGNIASAWKDRSSVLWGVMTVCVGALYRPLVFSMLLVIVCASKVKAAEPAAAPTDNATETPQA